MSGTFKPGWKYRILKRGEPGNRLYLMSNSNRVWGTEAEMNDFLKKRYLWAPTEYRDSFYPNEAVDITSSMTVDTYLEKAHEVCWLEWAMDWLFGTFIGKWIVGPIIFILIVAALLAFWGDGQ